MPRPSVKDRARMFAAKARPSIAGSGGNAALYAVAAGLVIGFGLDDADAWDVLCDYNRTQCAPSWSENELRRTLKNARRAAERDPGAVGELAREDGAGFVPRAPVAAPVRSPANVSRGASVPSTGTPRPRGPAPPSGSPAPDKARTPRTPVFDVRPAGEGARAATARTIRTLPDYSKPYEVKEKLPENEGCKPQASEVSSDLREAKAASPRPVTSRAMDPGPNVTTMWFDTGEVIRDGKLIGNLNSRKGGRHG